MTRSETSSSKRSGWNIPRVAVVLVVLAAAVVGGTALTNAFGDAPEEPAHEINRGLEGLPERVPVAGHDGQVVGYIDRDAVMAPPAHAPGEPLPDRNGGNPGADVTDASGHHVGWLVSGAGFMTDEEVAAKQAAGEPLVKKTISQDSDGTEIITFGDPPRGAEDPPR